MCIYSVYACIGNILCFRSIDLAAREARTKCPLSTKISCRPKGIGEIPWCTRASRAPRKMDVVASVAGSHVASCLRLSTPRKSWTASSPGRRRTNTFDLRKSGSTRTAQEQGCQWQCNPNPFFLWPYVSHCENIVIARRPRAVPGACGGGSDRRGYGRDYGYVPAGGCRFFRGRRLRQWKRWRRRRQWHAGFEDQGSQGPASRLWDLVCEWVNGWGSDWTIVHVCTWYACMPACVCVCVCVKSMHQISRMYIIAYL